MLRYYTHVYSKKGPVSLLYILHLHSVTQWLLGGACGVMSHYWHKVGSKSDVHDLMYISNICITLIHYHIHTKSNFVCFPISTYWYDKLRTSLWPPPTKSKITGLCGELSLMTVCRIFTLFLVIDKIAIKSKSKFIYIELYKFQRVTSN